MNIEPILIVFGLMCDLLGAFLLSIPLLWNTRRVAHAIIRFAQKIRWFFRGTPAHRIREQQAEVDRRIRSGDISSIKLERKLYESHTRIAVLMINFTIFFSIIAFRVVSLAAGGKTYVGITIPESGVTGVGLSIIISVIIIGIVFLISVVISLPLLFIMTFVAMSVRMIAQNNVERVVGMYGLVLLCAGFLIQSIVNMALLNS